MMRSVLRVLLVALVLLPVATHAQSQVRSRLEGRAVDTLGAPVPNVEVVLHRVGAGGGTSLALDTTDANGAFILESANEPVDTTSVYFAATRVDGNLYVGPFRKQPIDAGGPYELTVGGEPFAVAGGAPGTTDNSFTQVQPPPSGRRRALIFLPVIGLLAVGAWALARGDRTAARRRLLVRLAEIDEEAEPDARDPVVQRERARILEKLTAE